MKRDVYRRWRVRWYRRIALWELGIVSRYVFAYCGREE